MRLQVYPGRFRLPPRCDGSVRMATHSLLTLASLLACAAIAASEQPHGSRGVGKAKLGDIGSLALNPAAYPPMSGSPRVTTRRQTAGNSDIVSSNGVSAAATGGSVNNGCRDIAFSGPWVDIQGASCRDYVERGICTADGQPGQNLPQGASLADYALLPGLDAATVCVSPPSPVIWLLGCFKIRMHCMRAWRWRKIRTEAWARARN